MQRTNAADHEWEEYDHGETAFRRKELGAAVEAEDLGASLYELPVGKRSWPYHYHTANAEAIYVLGGSGTLRCASDPIELIDGDYVRLPADESGGHQLVNDGEGPLRYLVVSTMREPDVTVYPEKDEIGVYAGSPPGGREDRTVEGYWTIEDAVDYWE